MKGGVLPLLGLKAWVRAVRGGFWVLSARARTPRVAAGLRKGFAEPGTMGIYLVPIALKDEDYLIAS